jgi:hypothetical protein
VRAGVAEDEIETVVGHAALLSLYCAAKGEHG